MIENWLFWVYCFSNFLGANLNEQTGLEKVQVWKGVGGMLIMPTLPAAFDLSLVFKLGYQGYHCQSGMALLFLSFARLIHAIPP